MKFYEILLSFAILSLVSVGCVTSGSSQKPIMCASLLEKLYANAAQNDQVVLNPVIHSGAVVYSAADKDVNEIIHMVCFFHESLPKNKLGCTKYNDVHKKCDLGGGKGLAWYGKGVLDTREIMMNSKGNKN